VAEFIIGEHANTHTQAAPLSPLAQAFHYQVMNTYNGNPLCLSTYRLCNCVNARENEYWGVNVAQHRSIQRSSTKTAESQPRNPVPESRIVRFKRKRKTPQSPLETGLCCRKYNFKEMKLYRFLQNLLVGKGFVELALQLAATNQLFERRY